MFAHTVCRLFVPKYLATLGVALWLGGVGTATAQPEWKVGLIAVKITPERPVAHVRLCRPG